MRRFTSLITGTREAAVGFRMSTRAPTTKGYPACRGPGASAVADGHRDRWIWVIIAGDLLGELWGRFGRMDF